MRQKYITFYLFDLILAQEQPRGRKHHALLQQSQAEPSPECSFGLKTRGKQNMFSLKHLHCQHWKTFRISKSHYCGYFGQSWLLKDKSPRVNRHCPELSD